MEQNEKSIITGAYNESGTGATSTGAPASTHENSAPPGAMCPELWTGPLNVAITPDGANSASPAPASAPAENSARCPECSGTGADDMDGTRPLRCLACSGTGFLSSACPPDCAPGIKCDYCAPRSQAAHPAPEKSVRPLPHFTTRQALLHFHPDFLDETACREWVIARLHPGGAHCPQCGLKLDSDTAFRAGKRCHCGRCGRGFTATTGTFLEGMHFDFGQVYALALLIELKIAPAKIASMIGVSTDTVRNWQMKFRVFE